MKHVRALTLPWRLKPFHNFSVFCSKSHFEGLIELFHRYHKLSDILKEKSGKGRAPSNKIPRSLLSMSFISTLITVLFR